MSLNATISGIDDTTYDRSQAGSTLSDTTAAYRRLDFDKAVSNVCAVLCELARLRLSSPLVFRIKAYSDEFDQQSLRFFWRETLARHAVSAEFVEKHVKVVFNHDRITFARFQGATQHGDTKPPEMCASGFLTEKLVVGVHGQLGLCCQDGLREVVIGNIFEDSLEQIVSSAAYQQHLRVVTGRQRPPALHPCLRCEFYTAGGIHPHFPSRSAVAPVTRIGRVPDSGQSSPV